jgi:hypothetical protein
MGEGYPPPPPSARGDPTPQQNRQIKIKIEMVDRSESSQRNVVETK